MKNLELGTNTNLISSTNEEKPEDIYSILLDPINKAINKFGQLNPDYSMLSLVKLSRKEIKTSVMTKVYNVTVYGISQQLQSTFKSIFVNDQDHNKKEDVIKDSFEKEFYENPIEDLQ